MTIAENAQRRLLQEIGRLFEPLIHAARSAHHRRYLFASIGWNINAVEGLDENILRQLQALADAHETLTALIATPPETLAEVKGALTALEPLVAAVKALRSAFDEVGSAAPYLEYLDDLLEELLQKLLLLYLARWQPTIYEAAKLLTLIEFVPAASEAVVMADQDEVMIWPHGTMRFHLDRLAPLLKDPAGTLKSYYVPSGLKTPQDAENVSNQLFPLLARLLAQFRLIAVYGVDADTELDLDDADNALIQRMLSIRYDNPSGEEELGLGASLLLLSEAEHGPGLVVAPVGAFSIDTQLGHWNVTVEVDGAADAFTLGPRGAVAAQEGAGGRLSAKARFDKIPAEEGHAVLLGSTKGTRLEMSALAVLADLTIDGEGGYEVGLGVEMGASAFILSAGDGDGFLQKVLPGEVRLPFDFAIEWSSSRGLHIRGGGGLEANLPLNASLFGALDVDSVTLAIRPDQGALLAQGSMTATIRIGPVSAVIERVGIEARLRPVDKGDAGNLGPLDMKIGFKPPSGAALTIDAGLVTGGGYLFFDPANEQYAGALQLELGGEIALAAVGLLTTRLPGETGGFSLFVLISAEFPPMQLGYGFTLNGVGGLIGVNRTADTDALRSRLKAGAMNSILFPRDPAKNAPEIISNLNALFPAAADRVLIGPMARIGWGTPQVLTIDVGLVLEVPAPVRAMLLGRLKACLPSEDKPLVRLQMDALGILDLDKQQIALDATLYDSRLLEFVLTGDMALRAGWGENPTFLLAIGGYNPRFDAPSAFPKLNRVALCLQEGTALRLRFEAYLALTSNSVQFGARVDLHVEAAGFTIDALVYFDALFQFTPFSFAVDIRAMAAHKYDGHSLLAVKFDLSLDGPMPWHVRGAAIFEILCFETTVAFDCTLGRRERLAPPAAIHVRPLLLEALRDVRNWSGPLHGHPLVILRKAEAEDERLLLHPLAALTVRQRVAPLGVPISRFGNADVADGDTFALEVLGIDSNAVDIRSIDDHFAPAQFREMSEAEKLAGPAFEARQAGVSLTVEEIDYLYEPALDIDMAFETAVYGQDLAKAEARLAETGLSARFMQIAAEVGAAARARNGDVKSLRDRTLVIEEQY